MCVRDSLTELARSVFKTAEMNETQALRITAEFLMHVSEL